MGRDGPWEDVELRPSATPPEPAPPRLPARLPGEELWQLMRRVARDQLGLEVPEEQERPVGPPRPRRVKPYLQRLEEIYRRGDREPGEDG